MPLHVSLLEHADLAEFVEVDEAAMKDFPYAQAMVGNLPEHLTRRELIMSEMQKFFRQDDQNVWLKVVDSALGKIIAVALWQFEFETQAAETGTDGNIGTQPPSESDVDKVESFMEAQGRRGKEFKARYIGARAHAALSILVTHPDHQRRGAGSMLVKWGCGKADEYKMLSTLHGSPAGLNMYLKNGFEIVEQYDLDLRPWGVNETTTRRGMIRRPKQP